MKSLPKLLTVLGTAALASWAQANELSMSYIAHHDGSLTYVDGNAGDAVAVGDTVRFRMSTEDGFALNSLPGDYVWAITGMSGSGTRVGDFSWQFSEQGVVVGSGAAVQQNMFVHFGPYALTSFTGLFDSYEWTGVLTSSTTDDNVLDGWQNLATNATWSDDIRTQMLPEPGAVLLLGLGGAGLVLARRRRGRAS